MSGEYSDRISSEYAQSEENASVKSLFELEVIEDVEIAELEIERKDRRSPLCGTGTILESE